MSPRALGEQVQIPRMQIGRSQANPTLSEATTVGREQRSAECLRSRTARRKSNRWKETCAKPTYPRRVEHPHSSAPADSKE